MFNSRVLLEGESVSLTQVWNRFLNTKALAWHFLFRDPA